jgi:S-adenosylmethionine decarboxylase
MQPGIEWLVDAIGCSPHRLRDRTTLQGLCERLIQELALHVVGEPQWHQFAEPGAGLTGMYLLSESHLTCHSYPESGMATFNLHCCQPRPRWAWEVILCDVLLAESVSVRELKRGEP